MNDFVSSENMIFLILAAISGILIGIVISLIFRKKNSNENSNNAWILDLKNQLNELKNSQSESQIHFLQEQQKLLSQMTKNLNDGINASQGNLNSQLKSSNEVIHLIQEKLGRLEGSAKNMEEIGRDISSLQEILSAPKLRGNLGEFMLSELLASILPKSNYALQYQFKDGTKVDAVIKLNDSIVPVDSKFPLESFERFAASTSEEEKKFHKKNFTNAVKKQIDDISAKYIKPSEKTFDFALMYVPAENVYYEALMNSDLFSYAIKKRIVMVSPNSFYAYLLSIAHGLKGMRIEEKAKQITKEVSLIQENFKKFREDYEILGRHIRDAHSKYDALNSQSEKINEKLMNFGE